MAESYTVNTEAGNPVSPLKRASASVIRAQAKVVENGGRKATLMLKPGAVQDLEALIAAGYGDSMVGVITSALRDAARKLGRGA